MSLEHDQQLSEQVLVVVQPHLPLLALSQNRRERWPAQRTRCGHERFSSGNTTSSPRRVELGTCGRVVIPTLAAPPSRLAPSPTVSVSRGITPSCSNVIWNRPGSGFCTPCSNDSVYLSTNDASP